MTTTEFWLAALFAALAFNLAMRVIEVKHTRRVEATLEQMKKILVKLAEKDSGARKMILDEVLKQEPR